jgi:hypothetical protein
MSWTPNFFVLSKQFFDRSELLIKTVQRALMLILLGCPVAYLAAIFMQQLVPTLDETSLWSSALFMVIARMSSFAALSPAQFGFVISRRYKITTWVYFAELLVTAMAVGVTIYFDQFFWTFILSGIIPWLVVGLNYYLSIREISRPRNLSQI